MNEMTSHKSRTAQTCDVLRDAIVCATYAPGERLRIDLLCKTLDASSGAVREALSRLTAEGLVQAQPQKGFIVALVSRRDLIDLTEVRVEIETRCLEAAIKAGDIDWEARVLSIRHRLSALTATLKSQKGDETKEWHAMHEKFHTELVAACPNLWWLRLREQLYVQSERYRRLSGPADEGARDIEAEHNEITDAALARDAKAAKAAMKRHLEQTTKILLTSKVPFSDDATT